MLSTKKTHFSFHQILAFATVVNLVQLDSVLLLPPQGFRQKAKSRGCILVAHADELICVASMCEKILTFCSISFGYATKPETLN